MGPVVDADYDVHELFVVFVVFVSAKNIEG